MTRADEALDKFESMIEENVGALMHVHEVTKFEKTENGPLKMEITFSDGSSIEVTAQVL